MVNPCFPKAWPRLSATVSLGLSQIDITVLNSAGTGHGVVAAELDGTAIPVTISGVTLPLSDGQHELTVTLGQRPI